MRRISVSGLVLLAVLTLSCRARADKFAKLYDLSFSAPKEVAKGAKGSLVVTIKPKSGAEIHGQAPAKLKLAASGHLTLAKETLGNADLRLSGGTASFAAPFTAVSRGRATIDADLTFFICTASNCARQERKAQVPVQVR